MGSEESSDTVKCGAAFLFDIFKNVESVGQREATQLRNTFGPFPANAASKACELVKKIAKWLPESALAQLSSEREEGLFSSILLIIFCVTFIKLMSKIGKINFGKKMEDSIY